MTLLNVPASYIPPTSHHAEVIDHLLQNDNHYSCRCSQLHHLLALKFFPLAVCEALKSLEFEPNNIATPLKDQSIWSLLNWSRENIHQLKHTIDSIEDTHLKSLILSQLSNERIEDLGLNRFFKKHWQLQQPIVLVSSCLYSYWHDAVRNIGLGDAQVLAVDVNRGMQMDVSALDRALAQALSQNVPVLSVISTMIDPYTGNIDDFHTLLDHREAWRKKGLNYFFQVDSSFAGSFSMENGKSDGRIESLFDEKTAKSYRALSNKAASLIFSTVEHDNGIDQNMAAKDTLALTCALAQSLESLVGNTSIPANIHILNTTYTNRVTFLINRKSNHQISAQNRYTDTVSDAIKGLTSEALHIDHDVLPTHWFLENELNQLELSLGIDPNSMESPTVNGLKAITIVCDGSMSDEWFGRKAVRQLTNGLKEALLSVG